MSDEFQEKVKQYETFVNEVLRRDLEKVITSRDEIYARIAEYLQLKTVVERLQESGASSEELKTKVDLGCNFYIQAKVPDPSRIFVQVGFGFFVEFTLPEAIKFIDKKIALLTSHSDKLTKDCSKIKAHIKLVYEGLRELQNIQKEPLKDRIEVW